jgi:glutathione S-transferase
VPKPRLVTIGLSHYCEKARWALDRAGVGYVESAHVPVLHYAASLGRYGQRTTPLLVTPHGTIRDSTSILHHADRFLPEAARLFPTEPALLRQVEELEDSFDRKLGPATRRLAYFHVLDDTRATRKLLGSHIGAVERTLFLLSQPAITAFVRRGLRIRADTAKKSEERLVAVFDDVEKLLAGGGRYLVGDRFTAADLTFAALAAPVLAPPEYGWPLPALEEAPPGLRSLAERFRSRPAGAFALRLYREERRARPIPLANGA